MELRGTSRHGHTSDSDTHQPAQTLREGGAMFRKSLEVTAVAQRPFDDSPTAWMADGNCRSYAPAVFFPSDGVGVDRARAICKDCPVTATCLEYALENRIEHGVWGGCSERERRRILKRRRNEAEALTQ